jgi:hypothetical protein
VEASPPLAENGRVRRSLKSIVGSIAIVAAISVGLSGCVSTDPIPVPSRQALIGLWSHEGDASLALNVDGSFTLTDIPQGVIAQEAVSTGQAPRGPDLSLSGTWKRGSGGNDAGGAPGVQLKFDKPVGPNDALTMLVSGTDSNRQLYVNLGYPDSHTEYAFSKR